MLHILFLAEPPPSVVKQYVPLEYIIVPNLQDLGIVLEDPTKQINLWLFPGGNIGIRPGQTTRFNSDNTLTATFK